MAETKDPRFDPRYTHGPLVKVAHATHIAEAEFIANLLADEGIPSMVQRAAGFDVPDFLAAGPRDIFVPASAEEAARQALRPAS